MRKTKPKPPSRARNEWETVSFKVMPEMKKKIKADMVLEDCPDEAEYFRFLLRQRFQRAK
jgi:hypothetical protein